MEHDFDPVLGNPAQINFIFQYSWPKKLLGHIFTILDKHLFYINCYEIQRWLKWIYSTEFNIPTWYYQVGITNIRRQE